MDAPWLEVVDHLKSVSPQGAGVAAHERFKTLLPAAVGYAEIGSCEPESLRAVVIHKGLYEQIDANFLHQFLGRARPTFANAVFIVLGTDGLPLSARHPHLSSLRQIAQWAAAKADPWVQRPVAATVLPAEVALRRMAEFIVRHLAKPLDPGRLDSPVAIAETAERFNDTAWFWADDAGKTAELFALPELRDAYPELAEAALDHVLRLSSDRVIQRRSALPQLRLVDATPESFRAYNSFFSVGGNLRTGILRPAIRFNDGRTRVVTDYSGNVLRFRFRGRRQALDVENAIVRWAIEEHADHLVFSHTSAIHARPLVGPRRHVCDVTYRYTLWNSRPAITLEAEITTQPGVTLHGVQLSTAFDQLTCSASFDTVTVGRRGDVRRFAAPAERVAKLWTGPADYLGISEMGYVPGFCMGLHARLRNGADLQDLIAEGSQPGRFHWVYARYGLGRLRPGQTRRVVEDRLLTGGGYYAEPDIYCRLLDGMDAATDNVDPSMSYDIGAELNAVALTVLLAGRDRYQVTPTDGRLQALQSWYDLHLGAFLAAHGPDGPGKVLFIRGLSFVILSLDCMVRTADGERYRAPLQACIAQLLRLERPVEGAPDTTIFSAADPPELDSHSAALLALARAAVHGDPERRICAALERALRGTLILQVAAAQYGHPDLVTESLWIRSTAGGPPQDGGFWVFKLGLALRACNAIRQAQAGGFLSLDAAALAHLDRLEKVAHRALTRAARCEDDTIEVLTSECSGETNSETQPWAALGLVPAVEWELFGRPAVTQVRFDSHAPHDGAGCSAGIATTPARATQVEVIRTAADLDRKIEECNRAEAQSDDAMRRVFDTFCMEPPPGLPPDPFSPAYQAAQMRLYEMIAGKKYSTDSERSYFDLEQAVLRPFPFYTGSCTTSGDYLAGIGFLLRAMALPPGSRVIEFGAGWGLTSVWLAQLGHEVTIVEIDRSFCDLIARRAAHENVRIDIVNDDFSWIARSGRKFDCGIFYECFHHCSDHMGLLRALGDAIEEAGALFFAAEPVMADFPMPWGLRLDGNSLWAIRKNGWLELGFREDYFVEALRRTGWLATRSAADGLPMAVVWRARKRHSPA